MLNGTAILENNLVVSYQVKYVYQLMFWEKTMTILKAEGRWLDLLNTTICK